MSLGQGEIAHGLPGDLGEVVKMNAIKRVLGDIFLFKNLQNDQMATWSIKRK